jgi:hypothetical protein
MMTSTLLSSIAAVAIAVWIGSIVFQSFVVAPTIFKRLPPESAGVVLRALFPRFFRLGLLCGLVALGALLLGHVAGWRPSNMTLMVLLAAMTGSQLYALRLVPRINDARDAGPAAEGRFKRLHGLSVGLTVAVLLGGILVLGALSSAPMTGPV